MAVSSGPCATMSACANSKLLKLNSTLGGAWVTALINMASEDSNVRLVGAFAGVGSGEGLELD